MNVIFDPARTFNEFSYTGNYITYNKELDLEEDGEYAVGDYIDECNLYISKAAEYIIQEADNMVDINRMELFMLQCINNREAVATEYDCIVQESILEAEDPIEYVANSRYQYITEDSIYLGGNEFFRDPEALMESTYDAKLKKYLYQHRIKNTKALLKRYKEMKVKFPKIRYFFTELDKYKTNNIFVNPMKSYYKTFKKELDEDRLSADNKLEIYYTYFTRILDIERAREAGYTQIFAFIAIDGWEEYIDDYEYKLDKGFNIYDYRQDLNPISCFARFLKYYPDRLMKDFKGRSFLFYHTKNNSYFRMNIDDLVPTDAQLFMANIKRIVANEIPVQNEISTKANTVLIVDKIEKKTGITVHNLTGGSKEITKEELDDKIDKSHRSSSESEKDALVSTVANNAVVDDDSIDKTAEDMMSDEDFKQLLKDIESKDANVVKISASRANRIVDLNSNYMKSKTPEGKTVAETIASHNNLDELPVVALPVDSINDEWNEMESFAFNDSYDIQTDILAIMAGFGDPERVTRPINIVSWDAQDTSTSEDAITTYTFKMEDINGKRFTYRFDVPNLISNRFMKLRGNDKTINNQLILYPIIKTDLDTVQIVSNYNKVFIYRYGNKGFHLSDKIIKCSTKYKGKDIVFHRGDNSRICSKYELPMDYIDLAAEFNYIDIKRDGRKIRLYFNLDELIAECDKRKIKVDLSKSIPIGLEDGINEAISYGAWTKTTYSDFVYSILASDKEFVNLMTHAKDASKYAYSKASIMTTEIPVIIVCSYLKGLEPTLKESGIEYRIVEKNPHKSMMNDVIKFKDGYLDYQVDYESSMLMNGLKECNTEDYSIAEIARGSAMWLDFLDLFGGRLKADGLDNFNDLMMDTPITTRACEKLNLPKTFIGALLYGNTLLCDNKYNKHADITGNRFRCAEIISGYVYKCVAKSYADYNTQFKKTGSGDFTIKQSAIIDAILLDPTSADLSTLTPLLEVETANTVGFKGLSGMNSDRSYSLDKRTYDKSMINVMAMSTGFAGNVGIVRQATIDKSISGSGGYIKPSTTDDMSVTKSFGITEAVNPMCSTRDDPARVAMTFVQTAKHSMNTKVMTPTLVSNGADQALAYMCTDTYAVKAKEDGKVKEKTDEYMIVEYKSGEKEYIDLRTTVYKNSDGGFFITLTNITDMKEGQSFKKNTIIAYDKNSFNNQFGPNDNYQYTGATLCKVAIMNTDEGFEDSCIISQWMSEAMASDVILRVPVTLNKNTNVYNVVKTGDPVLEGDPLIIFQNSFDDEDANMILKNITDDEGIPVTDLGRIPIRSKVTGSVADITIYRTVDTDELSSSLKKLVTSYEKDIKTRMKNIESKGVKVPASEIKPTYTLPATGKLKNARESVMIEFYLQYTDKLSIGDKITFYSALKGVARDVFPKGQEPYVESCPEEPIHTFLSISSINGRMVCSPLTIGSLNRCMIELSRRCKEIYGMPWYPIDQLLMKTK